MTWFAAHVIMAVKLKDRVQTRFPVWENILLIEAESGAEAFATAEEYGRREEGDDDGTFHWDGQPAAWVFAGVRKLTECALLGDRPESGTEVTYTEMELESEADVADLAAGEPVRVRYNDRYRPPAKTEQRKRKPPGRKRA